MMKENLEIAEKVLKEMIGSWVWIVGDDATCKHWAQVDNFYFDDEQKKIVFEWAQYEEGPDLTELWDNGEFTIDDIGVSVLIGKEAEAEAKEFEKKVMEYYDADCNLV